MLCLAEIEMIKLAKQKMKAQEKRKSTPVVGDMQPLSDALPELTELISESNSSMANKSKRYKSTCVINMVIFVISNGILLCL